MKDKDEFIKIFSMKIRGILAKTEIPLEEVQEIRLRAGKPLLMKVSGKEYFVTEEGELIRDGRNCVPVSKRELSETMEYIANYSMYAYEEELRQGFLTIRGGHRVGVSGKAVVEQGRIRSIKDISFLNVRISHEVRGCANPVMSCLAGDGEVRHTLIISPPGCGKTTLLRDIIRQISDGGIHGRGRTVGVVDERSEIGGAYQGIPQNDLGIRTDLLDACPKAEGMMMLIRSMAPEVLAVDEIGSEEDIHALRSAINCGCRILATVHGNSLRDVCRKPLFHRMTDEKLFERYIILNHHGRAGNIARILDENGEALRERREAYA